MSEFFDKAAERDVALVKGLCHAARTTRMELREWVQMELKAVLIEAELQVELKRGEVGEQIEGVVERLRTINRKDLSEAVNDYDSVMNIVMLGGYGDVYDAHDQLLQGCSGLVRIQRELLEIRTFIGEL